MESTQFKTVIEKTKSREQKTLANIKRTYLTDGLVEKAREKIDIAGVINKV